MNNHTMLIDNSAKLNNVLEVAKHLMRTVYDGYYDEELHSVFSLIKILTDKMTLDNTYFTISNMQEETHRNHYSTLLGMTDVKEAFERFIGVPIYSDSIFKGLDLMIEVKQEVEVKLKNCPVIALPWKRERIEEGITKIGTDKIPWEQDKYNHWAFLWLPFGVTYIVNGNHSVYSGMNKGEGSLKFPNDYCKIFDISKYYDLLRFDGTYYKTNNGEKICKARNFEFGCIFEIGRLIMEKRVKFKGI